MAANPNGPPVGQPQAASAVDRSRLVGHVWRHVPLFTNAAGAVGTDALGLLGADLRISRESIVVDLAHRRVAAEDPPASHWLTLRRFIPPADELPPAMDSIHGAFHVAMSRAVADDETVAVSYSGGIDSTVVLIWAHDLCRREGRRLAVWIIDLTADGGRSTAELSRALLAECAPDTAVTQIVSPAEAPYLPEPDWSPGAPRAEAMPRLIGLVARQASEMGATRVLTGLGGDEIAAPRYLTPHLVRERRYRAAVRYLFDQAGAHGVNGIANELLACCFGYGARTSASMLAALDEIDRESASDVDMTAAVMQEFSECLNAARSEVVTMRALQGSSWAETEVAKVMFPYMIAPLAPYHGVPIVSPFQDPAFVSTVALRKVSDRYDEQLNSPYHRAKGYPLDLFPAPYRHVAHKAKYTYATALRSYLKQVYDPAQDATLRDCNIFTRHMPARWSAATDAGFQWPHRIYQLSNWLRGAVDCGATFV